MALELVSGQAYGKLTAIEFAYMKVRSPFWRMRCECGAVVEKNAYKIASGNTTSCGCLKGEKIRERSPSLLGMVFGRLTVVSDAGFIANGRYWDCLCECGKSTRSSSSNLRGGVSTSCGCARIEKNVLRRVDFVGKRFGRLVVLADAPFDTYRRVVCKCDCGVKKSVMTVALSIGSVVSCGCAHADSKVTPIRSKAVREISAANSQYRRTKAKGRFTAEEVRILYAKQKGKCAYCFTKLGDRYHRDHIMPLSLGGPNTIDNIQLLCQPCNQHKAGKHPVEWANQIGRLL